MLVVVVGGGGVLSLPSLPPSPPPSLSCRVLFSFIRPPPSDLFAVFSPLVSLVLLSCVSPLSSSIALPSLLSRSLPSSLLPSLFFCSFGVLPRPCHLSFYEDGLSCRHGVKPPLLLVSLSLLSLPLTKHRLTITLECRCSHSLSPLIYHRPPLYSPDLSLLSSPLPALSFLSSGASTLKPTQGK